MNKNIFITIACSEEEFLEQTILSAHNNSSKKNNLFFKVLNQTDGTNIINLDHINLNIELINYVSKNLHGLGKARMLSNVSDLSSAHYVLQIDSHMIFSKNWDEYLISYLSDLNKKHKKCIVSGYAISWYKKNNECVINDRVVDPLDFDAEKENIFYGDFPLWSFMPPKVLLERGHIDGFSSYPMTGAIKNCDEEKEIHSVAGNFVFSEEKLFKEILHDPWIFWGGDEIVFSMRAWTRGYKIFALDKAVVFHLDKDTRKELKSDWRLHENDSLIEFRNLGYLRIKDILTGKILGYWGSPSIEKLKEYEEFIDFNFEEFYSDKKDTFEYLEKVLQKNRNNDIIE
jgi:hypothetical protein